MECTNCGAELSPGVSFCTNCGAPVESSDERIDVVSTFASEDLQATGDGSSLLGASLESAVQANQAAIDAFEAHGQIADEAAARWAEAQAQPAGDEQFGAHQPSGAPEAPDGYVPPSYGAPAAAGAASAPFYQQDAAPNAHYSSQRSYEESAYGQDAAQPAYQQPSYGQGDPFQPPQEQVWPAQDATKRAFAMTLYVAGLIGLIFGLCVRDKNDEFITHHLNNCAVLTIGAVIATFLSVVLIGTLLYIYLLVMLVMGIVSAYNGDMKELPLIGKIHVVK